MEDQNPNLGLSDEKEEFSFQNLDEASPDDNFVIPKSKIRSPCWEFENLGFHGNSEGSCKYEEAPPEYQVKYDVFGKAIIEYLNSPFTYNSASTKDDSSRNNSHNKSSGKMSKNSLDNENDDEIDSDLMIEKENMDPSGTLLTPLKGKTKTLGRGPNSGTNTGRSPLQDITPPLGKKKINSSKIEVLSNLNFHFIRELSNTQELQDLT